MKSEPLEQTTTPNTVAAERPRYLALSTEAMRSLGYAAVDMVIEHFNSVEHKPVVGDQQWKPTNPILTESFDEDGKDAQEVLKLVRDEVFDHCIHITHPRFFAYVPAGTNFISVVAEQLAAGFDVFAGGTPVESSDGSFNRSASDQRANARH